jgi:hypothetical protein
MDAEKGQNHQEPPKDECTADKYVESQAEKVMWYPKNLVNIPSCTLALSFAVILAFILTVTLTDQYKMAKRNDREWMSFTDDITKLYDGWK